MCFRLQVSMNRGEDLLVTWQAVRLLLSDSSSSRARTGLLRIFLGGGERPASIT